MNVCSQTICDQVTFNMFKLPFDRLGIRQQMISFFAVLLVSFFVSRPLKEFKFCLTHDATRKLIHRLATLASGTVNHSVNFK